ncbi:hypothetical protein HYY75_05860, partial [bacterium]|nr:hypothetical protein [bacterium]
MRLNRRLMKALSTTLSVLILLTSLSIATRAEAGLFSKIKDTVKRSPVKSALAAVAVAGGAIIAAPYVASAVGAASGAIAAGGVGAAVTGIGSGILGIGSAIWGGIVAAGGFVTGALGAIGGAIGGVFSGIAGFIGGIIGSPLFIPALLVIGAAVVGYMLWKKYKRQRQDIGNGGGLPSVLPTVGAPVGEVVVSGEVGRPPSSSEVPPESSNPAGSEIPVRPDQAPAPTTGAGEVTPPVQTQAPDALKSAHADYIKAYNKYIGIVTNIGGSENPDEEMRTNMRRSDTQ